MPTHCRLTAHPGDAEMLTNDLGLMRDALTGLAGRSVHDAMKRKPLIACLLTDCGNQVKDVGNAVPNGDVPSFLVDQQADGARKLQHEYIDHRSRDAWRITFI